MQNVEQDARDLLEQIGVEDAQSFSSGDLVELSNILAEVYRYRESKQDAQPKNKTDIPEWITEAAQEIDLRFGEMSISQTVAEIIFEKYQSRNDR